MKNLYIPPGSLSVHDFEGDIQKTIKVAEALKKSVYIPDGTYEISEPIVVSGVGLKIVGDGMHITSLKAVGNFQSVFRFATTAAYVTVSGMTIATDGTSTKCVHMDVNSVVIRFQQCYFAGNLTGDLIHSNGQNLDLSECTAQVSSPNTYWLNLDCFNQNTGVNDCRVGGVGKGIRITNALTPGSNRVEGLKVNGTYFINTGATNIEIGTSLFTTICGSCLDQASIRALDIQEGADNVTISGCYIGSSQLTTATGISIAPTAGRGHVISGNIIGYAGYGVVSDATGSNRVTGLTITGNVFNTVHNPMLLDSVDGCIVTGNSDTGAPANGTLNIKGTFGIGSYLIDNNRFHTAPPALMHSGSVYKWGNNLGWTP